MTYRGQRAASESLGRKVLLVDRFDRLAPGARLGMVSALTILELDELAARWASYAELAEIMRSRFTDSRSARRELFARYPHWAVRLHILYAEAEDPAPVTWFGRWADEI